jgi:putative phosphoesterase
MEPHRLSVGVISDTHGVLRPQAVAALRGSDLIVHAGDVGSPEILDELRSVAPTFAVRGNVDRGASAESLPLTAVVGAGRGPDLRQSSASLVRRSGRYF